MIKYIDPVSDEIKSFFKQSSSSVHADDTGTGLTDEQVQKYSVENIFEFIKTKDKKLKEVYGG